MFCQIPFSQFKLVLQQRAFFVALVVGNFVFIPLLVGALVTIFPLLPLYQLGVLLVLLTPCIDYVIVFSHLGKGNSQAILAATPLLFLLQMLLLPLYLFLFLDENAVEIIALAPFIQSFLVLIVIPLLLAVALQRTALNTSWGNRVLDLTAWGPVPLMALTFFLVVASQIGQLLHATDFLKQVLPVYLAYGILAPVVGKYIGKLFSLNTTQIRTVAFSTSTRNSLVVLPLVLALPAPDHQIVAMVVVTQTIVEICFELLYIRVFPGWIR
jgi:ACR3 family arsenite efflux pump ArsB